MPKEIRKKTVLLLPIPFMKRESERDCISCFFIPPHYFQQHRTQTNKWIQEE
jgi:hypothetical protein